MRADKIALDVVTANRRVLAEDVDEVVLPGSLGSLGVRPGHTPLMTGLGVGVLRWHKGGHAHQAAVSSGFAEILPDRVSVLAETAEAAHEIDVERARASMSRAEKRLAALDDATIDLERARAALERARARLETSGSR
ncbi:MAG: F0F1 ATP synthase subunit epsilon [Acidobacteriota bacterium]